MTTQITEIVGATIKNPVLQTTDESGNTYTLTLPQETGTLAATSSSSVSYTYSIDEFGWNGYVKLVQEAHGISVILLVKKNNEGVPAVDYLSSGIHSTSLPITIPQDALLYNTSSVYIGSTTVKGGVSFTSNWYLVLAKEDVYRLRTRGEYSLTDDSDKSLQFFVNIRGFIPDATISS